MGSSLAAGARGLAIPGPFVAKARVDRWCPAVLGYRYRVHPGLDGLAIQVE